MRKSTITMEKTGRAHPNQIINKVIIISNGTNHDHLIGHKNTTTSLLLLFCERWITESNYEDISINPNRRTFYKITGLQSSEDQSHILM